MIARDDTNNKCREDQAQRIHHFSAMVDPALRALIHPTGLHAYTQRIFGFSGTTNKCRVRIAHAASRRGIKRVRGAQPTTVRIPSRGPMALAQGHPVSHPGPAPHSRDGGNPASFANDIGSPPSQGRRIKGRWNIGDYFLVVAQWIPAYAGITIGIGQLILPMGMPVEAVARGQPLSMGLSRHAAPGAKRDAVSGKATKKRVDQAKWIHRPSIPVASTRASATKFISNVYETRRYDHPQRVRRNAGPGRYPVSQDRDSRRELHRASYRCRLNSQYAPRKYVSREWRRVHRAHFDQTLCGRACERVEKIDMKLYRSVAIAPLFRRQS